MGTKADFYIMDHDETMEWLGSVSQDGGYLNIPVEILISGNKTMFMENVSDYITNRFERGILKDRGEGWPWLWADSRMTDYVYIFHVCTGKVYICHLGGRPMDPIKLIQGMDEIGADIGMGLLKFPVMKKEALKTTEEILKIAEEYGQESTETV